MCIPFLLPRLLLIIIIPSSCDAECLPRRVALLRETKNETAHATKLRRKEYDVGVPHEHICVRICTYASTHVCMCTCREREIKKKGWGWPLERKEVLTCGSHTAPCTQMSVSPSSAGTKVLRNCSKAARQLARLAFPDRTCRQRLSSGQKSL